MDKVGQSEQVVSVEPYVTGWDKHKILAAVESHKFADVWVGSYATDHRLSEEEKSKTAATINEVLGWFGVGEAWYQGAVIAMGRGEVQEVIPPSEGLSAGAYVVAAAPYGLDIESNEWGYADVRITVPIGNLQALVMAQGDFWTDYTYTNKLDGSMLHTPMDDNLQTELNGDDRYDCQGDVNYQLDFEIRFTRREEPSAE